MKCAVIFAVAFAVVAQAAILPNNVIPYKGKEFGKVVKAFNDFFIWYRE